MSGSASEWFGIAELADLAGVTPRTIRYYVTMGLLSPPEGAGPHRLYAVDHLLRLKAIKRLKETYLPLTEIRQRFAGISRSDLETLAHGAEADRASTALEYTEALLARIPGPLPASSPPINPSPQFLASLATPPLSAHASPELRLGRAYVFAEETDVESPKESSGSPEADVGASVWHRVTLAPGVELNYQLTGDRLRDSAVLRLIRNARQILKTVS